MNTKATHWPIARMVHDEIELAPCPKCGGHDPAPEYDARADIVTCQVPGCEFAARGPTFEDALKSEYEPKAQAAPEDPRQIEREAQYQQRLADIEAMCHQEFAKLEGDTSQPANLARAVAYARMEVRMGMEHWRFNMGDPSGQDTALVLMSVAGDLISTALLAMRNLTIHQRAAWLFKRLEEIMARLIRQKLIPNPLDEPKPQYQETGKLVDKNGRVLQRTIRKKH